MPGTYFRRLTVLLLLAGSAIACWAPVARAGSVIDSVRLWPAMEYTRVTFESKTGIRSTLFAVPNPERLVLDLEGVDNGKVLEGLVHDLKEDDPYIKGIRVGRFKPGVLRVVFDLKSRVSASTSLLEPVADYGYRLVLDIYPETPADPLMALLDSRAAKNPSLEPAPAAPASPGVSDTTPEVPQTAVPSVRSNARVLVAVDAGHGGEDPGAHGRHGTFEKKVTLSIARRLKTLIDAEPGLQAVLIRDGDYFIPLQERTAKARKLHADLFVSVHADAFINSDARGSSVFALSERGATSVAARWLAKRENDADLIGGVNINHRDTYLAQTLFDLSQTATINDSLKVARAVLGELGQVNSLHKGEVEQAGFAVLKSPDIPSILVETAFITNPDEEQRLNDPGYQEKLAEAILSGIRRYLSSVPPTHQLRPVRSALPGNRLAVSP